MTVSLVDVSLSTVVQLKERSADRLSRVCSAGAGILASVNTKPNIVAMSGAIMPEPLAMQFSVTSEAPMRTVRVATLGNVSVVMIAAAAAGHASADRRLRSAGRDRKSTRLNSSH